MSKSLTIMLWNANGLLNHVKELETTLKSERIDICLIAETHFTKQSYINIPQYNIYHTIHPDNKARGGSAVIVRSNIEHHEENKISTEEFQATTIAVKTTTGLLSVTAIYSPPRHNIKADQYKMLIESHSRKFIMGGDYNAKNTLWGSRLTTTKGRELYKAANETGCEFVSTGKPTYWPSDTSKIPDLIDFFIIRKVSKQYIKLEEGFDLNSDHSPIYLTLSDNVITKEEKPYLTNKNTDWIYFRHLLDSNLTLPTDICSIEELDEEATSLMKKIQQAAWDSTPIPKPFTSGKNYPKEVKDLIQKKRKLRRRWQQTRSPNDRTVFNRASQQLKRLINNIENQTLLQYLENLSPNKDNERSLWKAAKQSDKPINANYPIKNENGEWIKTDDLKADLFSKHLENIFQPNETQMQEVNLPIFPIPAVDIPQITEDEIIREIINLKAKKSPGFDLITAEILKEVSSKTIEVINQLMKAALKLKYVPSVWKVAEVIMVCKPGKSPYELTSYRPISLLPIISKLFERILLNRIKPIIERNHLIPNHQFGFREKHSTMDQVHRITNIIENTFEEGKVCSAVFLDIAQAFDKVWHDGLLFKLFANIPINYCQILESYLKNRYFRVKITNQYSNIRQIRAGVPQGSILGPVLYLLYTYDIPNAANTTIATFADDTAILSVGSSAKEAALSLQTAIDMVLNWTKKWRININNQKCAHVNFTYNNSTYVEIYMNGVVVPFENHAKYLGMTLDAKLKWKVHVKKKKEEIEIRSRNLKWLIGRNSNLSTFNKMMIYNQVLKPIWTYGIPLWGCANDSVTNIIQTCQNKLLRTIVNAPWYIRNSDLHRDLNVDSIAETISKSAISHQNRLLSHVNDEIRCLTIDNRHQRRRLQRTRPLDLVPTDQ